MPHSTSPEKPLHDNDDEFLPDAPPADPESDAKENNGTPANEGGGGVKLEEMFNDDDDDDDDDEFPASSAPDTKMETSPAPEVPE